MTNSLVGKRVAGAFASATRVMLGLLWLSEGVTKYRAHFGAADIALVVSSATQNSRVPGFFSWFAVHVLGTAPGLFGLVMPLLETCLGAALILGVLTLPAAVGSVAVLMTYWAADQLIGQYPVMVVLSAVVLVWPRSARRYGVLSALVGSRRRAHADALLSRWW